MSWGDDKTEFVVVINDEQQYSIWPNYKPIPAGWSSVGKTGLKADCLAFIDATWTDMRPATLRRAIDEPTADGASPEQQG